MQGLKFGSKSPDSAVCSFGVSDLMTGRGWAWGLTTGIDYASNRLFWIYYAEDVPYVHSTDIFICTHASVYTQSETRIAAGAPARPA